MTRYNCPNCAAPIEGERCPYCGTVIYDFAALQVGAPSYVKVRHGNTMLLLRLMIDAFQVKVEPDVVEYNAGGTPFHCVRGYGVGVSLEGHAVTTPGTDEPLVKVMITEEVEA